MAGERTSCAEILWDAYGVPHIYAERNESLFYAFGWAQARAHANLLLRLYGQSRGFAARYWGDNHVKSDRWVRMMGIPSRGPIWLEAQTDEFRKYLDAFASGINAYVNQAGDEVEDALRRVLPVTALDPILHSHRVISFRMLTSQLRLRTILGVTRLLHDGDGSNAWAIGPSRSASGHSMLAANPHLGWSDEVRFFEVHLSAPGVDQYGATQVGFPVLRYSFNRSTGFSQTVNPIYATDLYRLDASGRRYQFDGDAREFTTKREEIIIRSPGGTETMNQYFRVKPVDTVRTCG